MSDKCLCPIYKGRGVLAPQVFPFLSLCVQNADVVFHILHQRNEFFRIGDDKVRTGLLQFAFRRVAPGNADGAQAVFLCAFDIIRLRRDAYSLFYHALPSDSIFDIIKLMSTGKANPLWTRDFTIITLGSVVSMLGNAMSGFAVSLMVLDYTDSNLLYAIYVATCIAPRTVQAVIMSLCIVAALFFIGGGKKDVAAIYNRQQ